MTARGRGLPATHGPVYNQTPPCPSSPPAPEGDRLAMLPDTLGHLFDVPLRLAPSSVAVIQGDTTLTYQDLDAWCNRAANALAGLGVRAGHRVALMFSNDWRFLPAFLGPMRIGAVSVPLNIRMGDEALAYVIQDAEATVLIAGTRPGRAGAPPREPGQGPRAPRRRRARRPTAPSSGTRGSPRPRRASAGGGSIRSRCACSPTPPARPASPRASCSPTAGRCGTPTSSGRWRASTTRSGRWSPCRSTTRTR